MIDNTIYGNELELRAEASEASRMPNDKSVVDLGGGYGCLARADWVVDLMPYATAVSQFGTYGPGQRRHTSDTWVVQDLCNPLTRFVDKQFDYCFCSQTVEDVRDPIGLIREISRIARSGFISTIHWTYEINAQISTQFGAPRDDFVGYWHHRWSVNVRNGRFEFVVKPPFVHYDLDYKVPIKAQMIHASWSDNIEATEIMYPGSASRQQYIDFLMSIWGE